MLVQKGDDCMVGVFDIKPLGDVKEGRDCMQRNAIVFVDRSPDGLDVQFNRVNTADLQFLLVSLDDFRSPGLEQ